MDQSTADLYKQIRYPHMNLKARDDEDASIVLVYSLSSIDQLCLSGLWVHAGKQSTVNRAEEVEHTD